MPSAIPEMETVCRFPSLSKYESVASGSLSPTLIVSLAVLKARILKAVGAIGMFAGFCGQKGMDDDDEEMDFAVKL